jgi:hypothetical protein
VRPSNLTVLEANRFATENCTRDSIRTALESLNVAPIESIQNLISPSAPINPNHHQKNLDRSHHSPPTKLHPSPTATATIDQSINPTPPQLNLSAIPDSLHSAPSKASLSPRPQPLSTRQSRPQEQTLCPRQRVWERTGCPRSNPRIHQTT